MNEPALPSTINLAAYSISEVVIELTCGYGRTSARMRSVGITKNPSYKLTSDDRAYFDANGYRYTITVWSEELCGSCGNVKGSSECTCGTAVPV